ncbi:MAG: XRE family transcriptional regulator [Bdellovibrionaceae bacterium]|nr:XRE family transcriptional regulator [Pseudobdellovibrionaceae bacterium]
MKKNKPVFHDLGFSDEQSAALVLKSELHSKIMQIIEDKKISQKELIKTLKVPQPRISELINGKISSLSIEKLVTYLQSLGISTSVHFKNKAS